MVHQGNRVEGAGSSVTNDEITRFRVSTVSDANVWLMLRATLVAQSQSWVPFYSSTVYHASQHVTHDLYNLLISKVMCCLLLPKYFS